jgi:IclR family acetate operon transcriptional repressor
MTVPILETAIAILQSIAEQPARSSRELARRLDVSPSSTYRILQTLQHAGWIDRSEEGFRPGLHLLRVAAPLLSFAHNLQRIRPHVETLARHTGLTAVVTVREGPLAAVVDRADSLRPVSITIPPQTRTPIVESFAGPSLLADTPDDELEKIARNAGKQAFDVQSRAQWRARIRQAHREHSDLDPGIFHRRLAILSAPLRSSDQKIFAALSLLGLPGELTLRTAPRFRRPLLKTIKKAASALA